jgi:hypothetical protein
MAGSVSSRSIAGMFQDFVEAQRCGGLGMILFGESSPLTFALGEYQGEQAYLHDSGAALSRDRNRRFAETRNELTPPRLSSQDIDYLRAKGAFAAPEPHTLDALLDAFLTRFHPLYAIMSKSKLLQLHKHSNIPWIMLHAICLIGATFCDTSVIHRTPFSSRAQARSAYYGI